MKQCIVCRKEYHKGMFRLTYVNHRILLNPDVNPTAEPVYLCWSAECVKIARDQRLLEKVFPGHSLQSIYMDMAKAVQHIPGDISKLIGFGVRSMKIRRGSTAVSECLEKGKARLILIDDLDRGETFQKIHRLADRFQIPAVDYKGPLPFEQITGKPNCRCAVVVDRNLSEEIMSRIKSENESK